MAKENKKPKEPGRWGQIFRLFRETIKVDKTALLLVVLAVVLSLGVGVLLILSSLNNLILAIIYGALSVTAAMMIGLLETSRTRRLLAY
jgi:membrane protein required for beta-lactamase induction